MVGCRLLQERAYGWELDCWITSISKKQEQLCPPNPHSSFMLFSFMIANWSKSRFVHSNRGSQHVYTAKKKVLWGSVVSKYHIVSAVCAAKFPGGWFKDIIVLHNLIFYNGRRTLSLQYSVFLYSQYHVTHFNLTASVLIGGGLQRIINPKMWSWTDLLLTLNHLNIIKTMCNANF